MHHLSVYIYIHYIHTYKRTKIYITKKLYECKTLDNFGRVSQTGDLLTVEQRV